MNAATSLEVAISTIEGLQNHIASCNDTIVDLKVRCEKVELKVRTISSWGGGSKEGGGEGRGGAKEEECGGGGR